MPRTHNSDTSVSRHHADAPTTRDRRDADTPTTRDRRDAESASRGQTTMDFAAGISVFLVTVAFAFTFVPGIVDPFASTDVGDPVTANRVADELVSDRLAAPDDPYALNESAVEAFFDAPPQDALAVPDTTSVNVTLELASGETRRTGSPVPERASVTTAWRVVSAEGVRGNLTVRVW